VSNAAPRERAIRVQAVVRPMGEVTRGLPTLYPEHKVWRTGPPYIFKIGRASCRERV